MGLLSFLFAQSAPMAHADSRDSDSPFGVLEFLHWDHDWNGHHYTPEKVEQAVKLMKKSGVGFVRMDILWDDVEPAEGKWDFEKYDRTLDLLDKAGIKVLALLDYNAVWAGEAWNTPPPADKFTRYAETVVNRYKSKIKYWEIWNEPNQSIYWVPQDQMKAYTELLKSVYPAIKKADPTSQVLLGGLSGDLALSLGQVYQNGGKDYFDICNIHPFVSPMAADPAEELRQRFATVEQIMVRNGDADKPIWITEIGCPGLPRGVETANWWLGKNPTEKQQADWVRFVFRECLKLRNVKKVFWAFYRDTPNHFLTGTDYFGLVRENFTKKPSYTAFRRLAEEWSKGKSLPEKGNS